MSGSHVHLQGTPFFMPLEIHSADRLYDEPEDMPLVPTRKRGVGSVEGVSSFRKKPPRFRFQHDLESLWWIALWILLYRIKHPAALKVAKLVFTYGKIPTQNWKNFFTDTGFASHLKSIIPTEFSSFVVDLADIRTALHSSYTHKKFAADKAISKAATYSGVYSIVWTCFSTLADEAEKITFEFKDMPPEADETNATSTAGEANHTILQKRPRPEPKRNSAEYIPSPDPSDEDSMDEREAKKSKRGEVQRMQTQG